MSAKRNKTVIRTSRHQLKNANPGKLNELFRFVDEYRRVAKVYLDHFWDNGIHLSTEKNDYHFNAKRELNCPSMISTVEIDKTFETFLTARARKCCAAQTLGVIKASTEKQRKRIFVARETRSKRLKVPRKLKKALFKNRPTKPDVSRINPEINSICLDFQEDDRHFGGWLKLKSFTNEQRNHSVNFPIKFHRHSNRMKKQGTMMTSFLLTKGFVDFRWEIIKKAKKKKSKTNNLVGADQGETTVLSLGDGQETPETDCHGHSLDSILERLARRRKGGKAFRRSQDHRRNFINWSINQLNFNKIDRINFENLKNLRRGRKVSRKMSHWVYRLIRDKVEQRCEMEEVLLVPDPPTYMSQRCSECGFVLKSNRRGKEFLCKNCGHLDDADFNAAKNHQQGLSRLPWTLRSSKLNRIGFFWNSDGIFDLEGEALAVPPLKKRG